MRAIVGHRATLGPWLWLWRKNIYHAVQTVRLTLHSEWDDASWRTLTSQSSCGQHSKVELHLTCCVFVLDFSHHNSLPMERCFFPLCCLDFYLIWLSKIQTNRRSVSVLTWELVPLFSTLILGLISCGMWHLHVTCFLCSFFPSFKQYPGLNDVHMHVFNSLTSKLLSYFYKPSFLRSMFPVFAVLSFPTAYKSAANVKLACSDKLQIWF